MIEPDSKSILTFLLVLGASNTFGLDAGSDVCSGAASRIGILSRFFYWKNSAFKIIKNFSFAPRNSLTLFKKDPCSASFTPLSVSFNSLTNLLCSLSVFFKY